MTPIHIPNLFGPLELEEARTRIANMAFNDDLLVDNVNARSLHALLTKLLPTVQLITGVEHYPVHTWVSRYLPGGSRERVGFTQRKSTCQIFIGLQQDGEGEMPVTLSAIDGTHTMTITPAVGDGIFVTRGWVWERPPAPSTIGKFYAAAFHFVSSDHPGEIV